jgi:DNA-binding NarL/FixJ family response regulator
MRRTSCQLQLLTSALPRRPELNAASCPTDANILIHTLRSSTPDVLLFAANAGANRLQDMAWLRRLHVAYPKVVQVLLVESVNRDLVVNAFRSGVQDYSALGNPHSACSANVSRSPSRPDLANAQQIDYLLDLVTQVPSLRVLSTTGGTLLTPREEQVVALVAEGLSNRETGQELALSAHTVKKYLFRIFDKLGISMRVELVLYAINHGEHRPTEWLSGSA